jgi:DNA-binding MarR family transcriptional regulator
MKIKSYVQNSLLLAIGTSYDTIWRDLNFKLKKEDCNLLQAVILISLFFEESDSVTPSVLAEIFHTTRGNVSHCISHLEKRGWIKRQLDEKDARSYRLILKAEGKKAATRLIKIIDDIETFFEIDFGKQNVRNTISALWRIEETYRLRSS